ncbi:SIMPL domain-containing protein [Niabella beijingensis]|uniref:SIMPL domain-containing protein n=1 Tax=Niabella beijingensis TaxID=2872700 RepID=UPI001CC04C13|nr:SIMPL domain-containing protein [Niabella beijingensis]MBZ4187387.1 SIMPL domain-containing protein [Niabella beijingensis]
MNNTENTAPGPTTGNRNFIGLVIIGICIVLAGFIVAGAYKYKFKTRQTIRVTGSAEKDFTSDLVAWNGSYSRADFDLKAAYAQLKQDETNIKNYLTRKGITPKQMIFSSVKIDKMFRSDYNETTKSTTTTFNGYNLTQTVKVESNEIAKVEALSREITELIETGIELNSPEPLYFYTKLADLKLDLLAKAAEDARKRAETIAKNTGGSLGNVVKANMGIFQITGQNSNEDYSYGGAFNTSSKNKTASITVNLECVVK